MWATATFDLGLQPEILSAITFRQLKALLNRHREREAREDRRAALVACIVANANRDSKRKPEPFQVDDFMPGSRKPQGVEEQRVILMNWATNMKVARQLGATRGR